MQIYKSETVKSVDQFVDDLIETAEAREFLIHNEENIDMTYTFGRHGVEVAQGFDLQMIQICKPEKAAMSLSKNPERAVLMPKFIMVFSQEGVTQIRFLHYSEDAVRTMVDDAEFPDSLVESFNQIITLIEAAR